MQSYTNNNIGYATRCLICGEGVPLYSPLEKGYKICNKCKKAVMYIRKQLYSDNSKLVDMCTTCTKKDNCSESFRICEGYDPIENFGY